MILTTDNPIALSSDGEGLRLGPVSSGETTEAGLFSQILSSQEAISVATDKATPLIPPIGTENASGTLLPGGGNELPVPDDGEALEAALPPLVTASLIQVPLQDPTLQLQGKGGLIEDVELLISPPLLEPQDVVQKINLRAPEQAIAVPEVIDTITAAVEKLPPSHNVTNAVPAPVQPIIVQDILAPARKTFLPLQDLGQKLDPTAKSDPAVTSGFGAAAQPNAPIAQKPEISPVLEDASVELTQAFKLTEGISNKGAGGNTTPGSLPIPAAVNLTVTDTGSSSGLRAAAVTTLPTPMSDPNWNQEFVGRIGILVDSGVSEAKLQLTPADLGRMEVKISTEGDQTKVLFSVQNATAREAIEQAMPRLREMLGQDGLQLAHSEVSDHSTPRDDNQNFTADKLGADSDLIDEELDEFPPRSVSLSANTMVDYYV